MFLLLSWLPMTDPIEDRSEEEGSSVTYEQLKEAVSAVSCCFLGTSLLKGRECAEPTLRKERRKVTGEGREKMRRERTRKSTEEGRERIRKKGQDQGQETNGRLGFVKTGFNDWCLTCCRKVRKGILS
jgi:hypothetical protein